MNTQALIEIGVGLALLIGGAVVYRRGGTQGGVILMVIAALVLIHGLGLMDYRPSAAELGR